MRYSVCSALSHWTSRKVSSKAARQQSRGDAKAGSGLITEVGFCCNGLWLLCFGIFIQLIRVHVHVYEYIFEGARGFKVEVVLMTTEVKLMIDVNLVCPYNRGTTVFITKGPLCS